MRIPLKLLAVAVSSVALAGCAYGGLGSAPYGYGSPYGYDSPYGYGGYGSGVSVSIGYGNGYGGYGYGSPYGYGGYGSPYGYGGYGSPYGYSGYGGYAAPYYGWYNNYYYPGTGGYVYDSYRQPHVMSESQRRYWNQRNRNSATSGSTVTTTTGAPTAARRERMAVRENWSAFKTRRDSTSAASRQERANARQVRREQR